jgi:hypothetical protein
MAAADILLQEAVGAGTRYSTFNREALTDHKPLVTSLFRTTPPWSARQQRQLSFIAEFTSDIRHTPGQENVVANALSGPPSAAAQQLLPG